MAQHQYGQVDQGSEATLYLPGPLEKGMFDRAYRNFCEKQGVRYDPHPVVEDRNIDLHTLHAVVMLGGGANAVNTRHFGWEQIGGKLGFVSFPESESEPARSGPTTALVISNIYAQQLLAFDNVYITAALSMRRRGYTPDLGGPNPPMPGQSIKAEQQYGQVDQGSEATMYLPGPLEKGMFDRSYKTFCEKQGIKYDPHPVFEYRNIDLHTLHSVVLQAGGVDAVDKRPCGWEEVGGKLGLASFPQSETEPARSSPTTALVISNIYTQQLLAFDNVYITAALSMRRRGNTPGVGGPIPPMPGQSINAALSAVQPNRLQQLLEYAQMSIQELQAMKVDPRIITWVDRNRQHLLPVADKQRSFQVGVQLSQEPPNQVRSRQQDIVQARDTIQRLKQDTLKDHPIHSYYPVQLPPEQRMEYNNLVDQVSRSAAELENKIIMYQALFKDSPQAQESYVRAFLHLIVATQHQRYLLSSNNPRLVLEYDTLRQMLSQLAYGHEQYVMPQPSQVQAPMINNMTFVQDGVQSSEVASDPILQLAQELDAISFSDC